MNGEEQQNTIENYIKANTRRKPNGSIYRTRKDMKENYDQSVLPYPLAVIKLDYCWNIIKAHIVNVLFFSVPLSFVISYAFNSEVRTKGFKSKNRSFYVKTYSYIYFGLLGILLIDSLLFCEYCKPWSKVYNETGNSDLYKNMLKERIKSEQRSNDVNYKRTRMSGLKDEEL